MVNSEEGERKADTAEMAVFPQQSCNRVALPLLGLDLGKRSIFKPHIYPTVAYSNIYFGEGHFKGMEYPPTPQHHTPPPPGDETLKFFASRLDCVRLEGVGDNAIAAIEKLR